MSVPPDHPTEPLQPVPPPAGRSVVTERAVAGAVVDPAFLHRLEERVRSLRTLAALSLLLGLIGTALGAYAILSDEDTDKGPSPSRVARLSQKIDRIEARVGGASQASEQTDELADGLGDKADAADVRALQAELKSLRAQVASARNTGGASSDDSGAEVTALSTRVDELAKDVDELRAQVEESEQP